MGLFTWFFGCKNADNKVDNSADDRSVVLEEITSRFDPEEGWHDCFFKIISSTSTDSTTTFVCKGLHKGKAVGLQFEVRTDMGAGITPAGELNSEAGLVKKAVQIKSIGQESNELIKVLSELYGKPTTRPFIKQTDWITAYSLNQKPVDLNKSDYYKLKLFFDKDEDLYAEVFLNIKTSAGEIELNEKDEEYRDNVIKALTE